MAIIIKDLTLKIADKILIENLNVNFVAGRIYGILGPNGVGKTTLLHTIAGIKKCANEKIFINDTDITKIPKKKRAKILGLLTQEFFFNFPATVLETILLGRFCHNYNAILTPTDNFILAKKILKKFFLINMAKRCVTTLSSGEKMRVALAILAMQTPEIYLLDEPTNHLDILQQINTLKIFSTIAKKQNKIVIIVMHDINLIKNFCDNILIFGQNKNYVFGRCADILNNETLEKIFPGVRVC